MKAEFIDLWVKGELHKAAFDGDCKALDNLISEIGRLENIIREYEIAFDGVLNKVNSETFKKPTIKKND